MASFLLIERPIYILAQSRLLLSQLASSLTQSANHHHGLVQPSQYQRFLLAKMSDNPVDHGGGWGSNQVDRQEGWGYHLTTQDKGWEYTPQDNRDRNWDRLRPGRSNDWEHNQADPGNDWNHWQLEQNKSWGFVSHVSKAHHTVSPILTIDSPTPDEMAKLKGHPKE